MAEKTPEEIWNLLKISKRVFLTGKGGTGKTFTTRKIIAHAESEGYLVFPAASTGIAARNLSDYATTIHSFLKLGIAENYDEISKSRAYKKLTFDFSNDKVLIIIDEISMISKQIFEAILRIIEEKIERSIYGSREVLILLVGDCLQLAPVKSDEYFFESPQFGQFIPVPLLINKRNDDADYNNFLNHLRYGIYERHDKEFLQSCSTEISEPSLYSSDDEQQPIIIDNTNETVKSINIQQLMKLEGAFYTFEGIFKIDKNIHNEAYQYYLDNKNSIMKDDALSNVILKLGAKVMITKNDPEQGVVNGDIGFITGIGERAVTVQLINNGLNTTIRLANKEIYDPIHRDGDGLPRLIGRIQYMPLKLAWAITAHKSQGLSFENMWFNPLDCFTASQVYVGFSRFAGGNLSVSSYHFERKVRVNYKALDFQRGIEEGGEYGQEF